MEQTTQIENYATHSFGFLGTILKQSASYTREQKSLFFFDKKKKDIFFFYRKVAFQKKLIRAFLSLHCVIKIADSSSSTPRIIIKALK